MNENRERVLEAAAELFRSRGIEGISVAEIMEAAGLTHGGFYRHFESKDDLAAQACARAFEQALDRLVARRGNLERYTDSYLTERHRDRPEQGCPIACFAAEIGGSAAPVQASYVEGLTKYLALLAERMPRRAIALMSTLVGALLCTRDVSSIASSRGDPCVRRRALHASEEQTSSTVGEMTSAGGNRAVRAVAAASASLIVTGIRRRFGLFIISTTHVASPSSRPASRSGHPTGAAQFGSAYCGPPPRRSAGRRRHTAGFPRSRPRMQWTFVRSACYRAAPARSFSLLIRAAKTDAPGVRSQRSHQRRQQRRL
jgi:TetR/AcrR family transcriptional repressor of nem operon